MSRAVFDIYADPARRALGYVKEGCTALDRMTKFFVHVHPVDVGDVGAARRRYGFDNLNFVFLKKGAWTDTRCWTKIELPAYPIARVHTGQFYKTGPDQYVQLWESVSVQPFNDTLNTLPKTGNQN